MNLERHQVQHIVNCLLIGDTPATFRYHGIAFSVERLVNGYTVTTAHGERFLHSMVKHKNLTGAVMVAVDELTRERR